VAQDLAIACADHVETYCAGVPGGCPTSSTEDTFCPWLAERSTPGFLLSGPVNCEGDLVGYDLEEPPLAHTYLFDGGQLRAVLEYHLPPAATSPICVAGPPHFRDSCEHKLGVFVCPTGTPLEMPNVASTVKLRPRR
jgi:hypothetical protein